MNVKRIILVTRFVPTKWVLTPVVVRRVMNSKRMIQHVMVSMHVSVYSVYIPKCVYVCYVCVHAGIPACMH